jgi:periplasmic divalent cation tolerance protein
VEYAATMTNALEVHITAPDRERAQTIARTLVDERLAACVNIVADVRSVYRWEGQIQEDDEVLCLVKTRPDLLNALCTRVRALHPYEVPEILAFEVADGSPTYLEWLAASTGPV